MGIQINGNTDIISATDGSLSIQGADLGSVSANPVTIGTGASISSPATNVLTLGTNNTEVVRIDSSGNLGIGTNNPDQNLVVFNPTTTCRIRTKSTASNTGSDFQQGADGTAYLWNRDNADLRFGTNNTEKARITGVGSFGIGTNDPKSLLHLEGSDGVAQIRLQRASTNIYGIIRQSSAPYGITYDAVDVNTGAPTHTFRTSADGSTFSSRVTIDSSGRLLVGATSARTSIPGGDQGLLIEGTSSTNSQNRFTTHVFGSSDAQGPYLGLGKTRSTSIGGNTVVQSGDEFGAIYFHGSDGSTLRQGAYILASCDGTPGAADMPGRLVFATTADGESSPTERMRIISTGNVIIGTQNDLGYKLGILATTTATPSLYLRSNAAGDVGTAQLRIIKADATNTTSQIFIQFIINGNNTNSGQINANGASQAAFGSFSDVRLKENIEDLPSQINNIKALRPVEFDYKDKSGHQIGFVAQEMEQIYPDAIGVGENEMLTITGWSKTEARLVKALQEAIAKIESLEARLAAAGI